MCVTILAMNKDLAQRRQRVADYVKRYREDNPKYTHAYIKANGGPSGPTVTSIEEARSVKPFSIIALEEALDLPEGTLTGIMRGEEVPPPNEAAARQAAGGLDDYSDDELLAEVKRRMSTPMRRGGMRASRHHDRINQVTPRMTTGPVYKFGQKDEAAEAPEWYHIDPFGTGS